ncbi:hypothetical protein [Actinomycetospora atypica]|uniref:XRE family transcriptional regulator n=1 Tax=Actinomycetospora atypica TaxID=1290095 RepID=A0ABV9YWL9_9PSEU
MSVEDLAQRVADLRRQEARRRAALTAESLKQPRKSKPEVLAELSKLLGVDVVDVEDRLNPRTSRKERSHRWVFLVRSPEGDTWTPGVPDSSWLRRPDDLNRIARWGGRDPELPALDANDGRRVLRLMHEVVEAEDGTPDGDDATNNTNRS